MTPLLLTLCVCCASAFLPLVNAEAYLAASAVTARFGGVWGLAAAAAMGQMAGKSVFYLAGQRSTQWRWLRRREIRWTSRLARLEEWAGGRPMAGAALLLVSATSGLPPFALVSVLAGRMRLPFGTFLLAGFTARWVRFAAVVGAAGWITHLWA